MAYAAHAELTTEYPLGNHCTVYIETAHDDIELVQEHLAKLLYEPFIDEELFQEIKGLYLDWKTLVYKKPEEWAHSIKDYAAMGIPLKRIERLFPRTRAFVERIELKDMEGWRQEVFTTERCVTVILKPS